MRDNLLISPDQRSPNLICLSAVDEVPQFTNECLSKEDNLRAHHSNNTHRRNEHVHRLRRYCSNTLCTSNWNYDDLLDSVKPLKADILTLVIGGTKIERVITRFHLFGTIVSM